MATATARKSKSAASVKPSQLVLKYYQNGTLQYSYFTANEKDLALYVAAQYDARGYSPRLYYSPYDGEGFKTLYDAASRKERAARKSKAAPVKAAA